MQFKQYLISEGQSFFAQKIGDILEALQDLSDNSKNIGTRQLIRYSEEIVNHMRIILHTHWGKEEEKYLRTLQKIGVAIMRAIDEKDDLPEILVSATQEMQTLMSDLGVPMHNLGSDNEGQQPAADSADQDIPKGV
jgi:alpha-ketoglutarate-dependent taurine dioxygenase